MTDYGATDTSTTTLTANQFPVSAAWVPGVALTPVEGMAVNTDGGGKKSTAIRMGLKDGDDVTLGLTTQTKATDGSATSWTVIQLLKGQLDKLLNGVPVTGTFWQATQPVSGTVAANAGTNLNTSLLALENGGNLASSKNDLDTIATNIPAKGQALAAASMPVVLTAAQITTLTPPAAISGFALEAGHIATIDSHIPAQGQALAAASMPVVLTAAQITTLTPPAAITGFALEAGNLASILTQVTNHTVQPGNTPNTTPWLASDHDGTTKAQNTTSTGANANGAARLVAGAYQEIAGQPAGNVTGTSTDLFPSTDMSAYTYTILQMTGTWNMTLQAQWSNDNVNFNAGETNAIGALGSVAVGITANGAYILPKFGRYLRIRPSVWTSNASGVGTLECYTQPIPMLTGSMSVSGTSNIQGAKTNNNAVPGATNVGVLPGIANAAAQAWTEGDQVLESMDLAGNQRVVVGPGPDLTILASAARTTTQTSADQINTNGKGLRVVLDMTTVGTGSVTLTINAKDVASGKYMLLLSGAAVTTNSTNVYMIYPELTAAANSIAQNVVPHTWQIVVTANNANSATYSVGASYLI